jgi:branched-chain amino acid transport system substrate-binding protein
MNRKAVMGLLVVVVVLVLAWAAWRPSEGTKGTEWRIGVVLPLTGPGGAYGKQAMDGISLGAREAEKEGLAKPQQLKLIVEDSGTDPKRAVSAIMKLIDVDGVKIVIGELASSLTLACAPIAERHHVLLLSPGSSADKISEAGDYVFRIAPIDSYDGQFLAEAIYNRYHLSSTAILHLNNDFGNGLARRFTDVYVSLGGKVVATEAYVIGATDFRTALAKIKASAPEAILLICAGNENVTALKQMKEMAIPGKVFAPSTLNDPELIKTAGNAAEGVVFSAAAFEGIRDQRAVSRFLSAFKQEYEREPTTFSAYGYDSVMILLSQIKNFGYDATEVKDALYQMAAFSGASGKTTFDKNGDAQKELTLFQVLDGKIRLLPSSDDK